ncbi:hypothetical protein PUN28_006301 [Cardiocondyla obscurior]|uniref:Uncharacterized protein n=1 Tax=Cardiocondyla obscurior TaxID=286306 RepID=A0AAW2GDE0_9HYME
MSAKRPREKWHTVRDNYYLVANGRNSNCWRGNRPTIYTDIEATKTAPTVKFTLGKRCTRDTSTRKLHLATSSRCTCTSKNILTTKVLCKDAGVEFLRNSISLELLNFIYERSFVLSRDIRIYMERSERRSYVLSSLRPI